MPHGELVFQILAAVAQWERNLIGERVRSGIARARKEGTRFGRPPLKTLTLKEIQTLRRLRKQGKTFRALAAEFGTSVWNAHRLCLDY